MIVQDDTEGRDIEAKDKRQADILWKILLATRLVIPVYVIYAIYLYWTMPIATHWNAGGY
ncbi:MAG: hypothetical protein ACLP4V_08920 [Methylocella sp.]